MSSPRSTRSGRSSAKPSAAAETGRDTESSGKEQKPPDAGPKTKGKSPKQAVSPETDVSAADRGGSKTRRGSIKSDVASQNASSPSAKSPVRLQTKVEKSVSEGPAADSPNSKTEVKTKEDVEKSPAMASPPQKTGSGRKGSSTPSTPSLPVRRSGRAPVPSSRFKDMEMEIGSSRKRASSHINATSEDSLSESEPQKKKSRKLSEKSQHSTDNDKSSGKEPPPQNTEDPLTSQTVIEGSESETVPLSIEEMIQSNLQEAGLPKPKDKTNESELATTEFHVSVIEEQNIETETVESDHIQITETTIATSTGQEVAASSSSVPTISIGGQQLTFTQRDGETVAIVTIPPRVSRESTEQKTEEHTSSIQDSNLESADQDIEKAEISSVSVTPGVHGHVVGKDRENSDQTLSAVVAQDGSAYLNLSVEATSISSILKGKHLTPTARGNPSQGHGRVLKHTHGSMIVKTSLVPPTKTQETPSSQETSESKPTTSYSLLYTKPKPKSGESSQPGETSVTLPGSIKQTPTNPQSAQRIVVVRQQVGQKPLTSTGTSLLGVQQAKPAPTVIRFPEDLPGKKPTAVTSQSTTVESAESMTSTPKTASELLLQKLKEQQKRVIIKESVHTADSLVKESQTEDAEESEDVPSEQNTDLADTVSQSADGSSDQQTIFIIEKQDSDTNKTVSSTQQEDPTENTESDTVDTFTSKVVHIVKEDSVAQAESQHSENVDTIIVNVTESTTTSADTMATVQDTTVVGSESTSQADSAETSVTYSSLTELRNVDPTALRPDSFVVDAEQGVETSDLTENADTAVPGDDTPQSGNTAKKEKLLEKIRVVDGGQELDVRVISEEEVTEEIIESSTNQSAAEGSDVETTAEVEPHIIIKQEVEEGGDTKQELGKQTSGTQTVYSPRLTDLGNRTQPKLATVVGDGMEKKHIYYVSVIPSKGIVTKSKTNMSLYSAATNWIVNDNGMFCCEKCDYQTDRKANFYKHRRSHSGAKPHVCTVCGYKAGTSSNLKRHMGIHKDIREHKCDICGLCFRQKIHLERHIKYKHEEKSIKCPMCDYICANEQPDLKMHIKRRHSNENMGEVLSCPECKVEVGNKRDLKQHMKFHKDGPELKLFCKECSFVTDCQSRLKRHTAIHSKQKPFQCGVCNYRAAQKEHVLRHLRTQHKIDVKKEKKRPWKRHKKPDSDEGSRERADFTSGDKIFACNHCTMRFAKLINLYKHLHTQHSDIMPAETEGNYYCVVCEYSTSSKKNLLVHMRRHNMADQTPPTHVYSCVLCRYVNPRRRNLFQHMRKKHNIVISRPSENGEDDGESQDNMEINEVISSVSRSAAPSTGGRTTSTDSADVKESSGDLAGVANMIKIEDLTRSTTSGEAVDMQTLVIDSRGTAVSDVVHGTAHADALEGLQALAEQAGLIDNIIEEQVPVLDEQPTIVIDQNGNRAEVIGTVEGADGQIQQIIQSEEAVASSSGAEATQGVELTEDQLSSLRTGDMVEMEGELYMVEMTQDPSNPNKQMLSFLPVTTQQISQEA